VLLVGGAERDVRAGRLRLARRDPEVAAGIVAARWLRTEAGGALELEADPVAERRERLRVERPASLEVGDVDAGVVDQSEISNDVKGCPCKMDVDG
jgi:hypothetical protein